MALPVVVVSSGGLPVSESTSGYGLPVEVSINGLGLPVTIVYSGGLPVVGVGAVIILSASTISEDASIGDLVGMWSVSNGSGSYTFTLTDDAGGLFALDAGDDTLLEVAGTLSAGSESITVEADNGVDDPISRAFLITVTAVGGGGDAPSMQFDVASNSMYVALLEDF